MKGAPRRSNRPVVALVAGAAVAVIGLGACGGGSSSSTGSKGANDDAAAACAALTRSTPVNAGTIALRDRLLGAAEFGLAAVGENGTTYSNLEGVFQKLLNDVNGDNVALLNGDVTNALAICKGDSLPH